MGRGVVEAGEGDQACGRILFDPAFGEKVGALRQKGLAAFVAGLLILCKDRLGEEQRGRPGDQSCAAGEREPIVRSKKSRYVRHC